MRKIRVVLISVLFLVSIGVVLSSCDKEAAERKIFNDPVIKKSLLDKMMADSDMMDTLINHTLEDKILSDSVLIRIIRDENLRNRMLTKAFEDSTSLEDIIFRIKSDKILRKRVLKRK